EVPVRIEAEAPRVLDRAEHEVLGELERDRDPLRLPRSEVMALEAVKLAPRHPLRPDRVLDAEAPCIDQVAVNGQLLGSVGRSNQHAGDTAVAGVHRRPGVIWPISVTVD